MACRLLGAKLLTEPTLAYCKLDPWDKSGWDLKNVFKNVVGLNELMSVGPVGIYFSDIWTKCKCLLSGKYISNCRLQNQLRLFRWGLIRHDDVIKWNIFHVTGPLCGEFTGHRWIPLTMPVTRSFDVFFDLGLNKRLSKQSRRRWYERPLRSLWRYCNGEIILNLSLIVYIAHITVRWSCVTAVVYRYGLLVENPLMWYQHDEITHCPLNWEIYLSFAM